MENPTVEAAEPSYGWTIRVRGRSLVQARKLVTGALARQGFGILTEIDVAETLRRKLGEEVRPYVILGACNPQLAHRALAAEPSVGLLLPCNVCVWEEGADAVVAIARPDAMFQVVRNAALEPIAAEAQARLLAALRDLVEAAARP
jgi:uncharacterized protein (DUF302 family)